MSNNSALSFLSTDALDAITSLLSGFEIMSLWSCGNKALNLALSKNGGVRVLRFKFQSETNFPKLLILPNAVSEFEKLRKITMKCPDYNTSDCFWLPRWSAVCDNLQTLSFKFPKDGNMLVSALSSNPSRFSNLTTLKFHMTTLITPLKDVQLCNFPNLTKLVVGGTDVIVRLSEIPQTLISLSLNIRTFEIQQGDRFPEQLLDLTLGSRVCPLFFSLLPSTLQNLKLLTSVRVEKDNWYALPRGLKSFSCFPNDPQLHHIQALPIGLTSLSMIPLMILISENLIDPMMKALPPHLKTMPHTFFKTITASNIGDVPKNLEGRLSEPVSADVVHLLPPKITAVVVSGLPSAIQDFPNFLQEIWLPSIDVRTCTLLPRSIRKLFITEVVLDPKLVSSFPRTLSELGVDHCSGFQHCEDIKRLPRSLTSLRLSSQASFRGIVLTPESSRWFPRRLTDLNLGQANISDAEWFASLPPNLNSLVLRTMQLPPTSFEHLKLEKLKNLGIVAVFNVSNELKDQQIPNPTLRFDFRKLLPALPPSLITMYFNAEEPHHWRVMNQDVASLPKHLRQLTLGLTSQLRKDCLPNLPKSLHRFVVYRFDDEQWLTEWFKSNTSKRQVIYKTQINKAAKFMGINPSEYF